ncbi:hypothetical protein [Okeania sp. SIO3I5]|uniref:hypothetical protein n=1 Tax=Okeania sp. SIO3I5 TaxID=2607805 RepID=UPI0035C8ED40
MSKYYLLGIDYLINRDHSEKFYPIIGNYAQTLPYQEFYQAWHPPFRFKKSDCMSLLWSLPLLVLLLVFLFSYIALCLLLRTINLGFKRNREKRSVLK